MTVLVAQKDHAHFTDMRIGFFKGTDYGLPPARSPSGNQHLEQLSLWRLRPQP